MEPPYLMNSKIILTTVYSSQVFLNEFWSITCPRAQQTTPFSIVNGRGQRTSGRGFKIHARSLY